MCLIMTPVQKQACVQHETVYIDMVLIKNFFFSILRSISEGKSSGDDGRLPFQENLGVRDQVLVALYQAVLHWLRRQHQSRPEPHTKI